MLDLDYQSPRPPPKPNEVWFLIAGTVAGAIVGGFVGGWLPLHLMARSSARTGFDAGNGGICCVVTIPAFAVVGAVAGFVVAWLVMRPGRKRR